MWRLYLTPIRFGRACRPTLEAGSVSTVFRSSTSLEASMARPVRPRPTRHQGDDAAHSSPMPQTNKRFVVVHARAIQIRPRLAPGAPIDGRHEVRPVNRAHVYLVVLASRAAGESAASRRRGPGVGRQALAFQFPRQTHGGPMRTPSAAPTALFDSAIFAGALDCLRDICHRQRAVIEGNATTIFCAKSL